MPSSILVRDYASLTMTDRANAIEQARQFGAEAMDSDLAGDGVEIGDYVTGQIDYISRAYLSQVVEPLFQSDECSDVELDFWKEEVTPEVSSRRDINDPRLRAFIIGWQAREFSLRQDAGESSASVSLN